MDLEVAVSLLVALGIGGVLGAFFQTRFEERKDIRGQQHEFKLKRYSAILILMITVLDPENGLKKIRDIRPDIKTLADAENEIETEFFNSFLFAGDDVISTLSEFIKNPSYLSYSHVSLAMRKDLWGHTTKLDVDMYTVIDKRHDEKSY